MSTHINAPDGAIAEAVLLPGDPLRAKFIAETFLKDIHCYNEVRGMYGFTGTYNGKKVSVQGTGMGQPSISIYVNELFRFYGVQKAIRVGTCGAVQKDIALRDVILAQGACTDSAINTRRFKGMHYAPIADFSLLSTAHKKAVELGLNVKVGLCVSSDVFYDDDASWKLWAEYGALGIEMEASELYTLAAKYKRQALAILTVSDHILLGGETTAEERQTSFTNMIKVALETATA
ncbi:MAG: purine-nucleoside phosphorylase [Treponema sp.]|nr:purine-nucleoside phosphorylase [Treponema sp.]MBR7080617.1 purine-nucleoside phosphorylase [Treponema sp.]